jgi:hypothetical protein
MTLESTLRRDAWSSFFFHLGLRASALQHSLRSRCLGLPVASLLASFPCSASCACVMLAACTVQNRAGNVLILDNGRPSTIDTRVNMNSLIEFICCYYPLSYLAILRNGKYVHWTLSPLKLNYMNFKNCWFPRKATVHLQNIWISKTYTLRMGYSSDLLIWLIID